MDTNSEFLELCKAGVLDPIKKALANPNLNLNFQDEDGQTGLILTIQEGHLEIAKTIIAVKANVNLQDIDGNSALHIASQEGFVEIVELLLASEADINLANKDNFTALALATECEQDAARDLLVAAGGIILPPLKPKHPVVDIRECYKTEINYLSTANQHTVTGVLYSVVFAVINSNLPPVEDSEGNCDSPKMADGNRKKNEHKIAPITEVYNQNGEFIELPYYPGNNSTNTMLSALLNEATMEVPAIRNDVNTISSGDEFSLLKDQIYVNTHGKTSALTNSQNEPTTVGFRPASPGKQDKLKSPNKDNTQAGILHPADDGMLIFYKHAVVRLHIARLTADTVAFPNKPEMSAVERGIKETELLHFSSLSTTDLYRANQLQEIGTLLQSHIKPLPNFTNSLITTSTQSNSENGNILKRRYFRELSAFLFAQTVQAEMILEPEILRKYYPLTDDLLFILNWTPPDRRNKQTEWANNNDVLGTSVKVKTTTLTPAGKSIVLIKQITTSVTSVVEDTSKKSKIKKTKKTKEPSETVTKTTVSDAWVSIYINNCTLGLRSIQQPREAEASTMETEKSEQNLLMSGSQTLLNASKSSQVLSQTQHSSSVAPAESQSRNQQVSPTEEKSIFPTKTGYFFCETQDNVRILACSGPELPPGQEITKPDILGTVCLNISFPAGMTVSVCSNGTFKITPNTCDLSVASNGQSDVNSGAVVPVSRKKSNIDLPVIDPLKNESSRVVGMNGTVRRNLSIGPYSHEILSAEGHRTLFRRNFQLDSVADITAEVVSYELNAFHKELLRDAPKNWEYIHLSIDGSVTFYCVELIPVIASSLEEDSVSKSGAENEVFSAEPELEKRVFTVPHTTFLSIRDYMIDAETKAVVSTYMDGRLIVDQVDGSRKVLYSDGTSITTHANKTLVFVEKRDFPLIEMDIEVDNMCRSHSRGIEVPINKGGERVRSRVALPDGTAVMVKYDTRVTAATNGSIKLVRRDKTVILVKDNGVVTYAPRTSWNEQDAKAFAADSVDAEPSKAPIVTTAASMIHGTFTSDMNNAHQHHQQEHSYTSHGQGPKSTSKSQRGTNGAGGQSLAGGPSLMSGAITAASGSIATNKFHGRGGDKTNMAESKQMTVNLQKTSVSGKNNKKLKAVSVAQDASTGGATSVSGNALISTESHETKFTMNIKDLTCRIEDYEYNVFSIDLVNNPLEPKILLSGEVVGLKPPAISDNPMEPRVFIVNRAAEATEVVSIQEVESLEALIRTSPEDVHKINTSVEIQPSDLGPSEMSKYFIRRRLLGGCSDSVSFSDIFGQRDWHEPKTPAAASYALRNVPAIQFSRKDLELAPPRYFQTISLVEHPPLSTEGYTRLLKDIQRCEDFRKNRLASIDRFAIEDRRSAEDLEEEEAMTKRLKQAYKLAKIHAAKKREQRKEAAALAAAVEEPQDTDDAQLPLTEAQRHAKPTAIAEGRNEDGGEEDEDGADDNGSFGDDDEPEVTDPVELELRATFADFAEPYGGGEDPAGSFYTGGGTATNSHLDMNSISDLFLPKHLFQDALIRLCNVYISKELIEKSLEYCVDFDHTMNELTLNEFRSLYRSVLELLANGGRIPQRVDSFTPDNNGDEGNSNSSVVLQPGGEFGIEAVAAGRKIDIPSSPRETTSYESVETYHSNAASHHSSSYWQSPVAKKNLLNGQQMAPPLDFRTLDKYDKSPTKGAIGEGMMSGRSNATGATTATGGGGSSYAAGSAVNVARQYK